MAPVTINALAAPLVVKASAAGKPQAKAVAAPKMCAPETLCSQPVRARTGFRGRPDLCLLSFPGTPSSQLLPWPPPRWWQGCVVVAPANIQSRLTGARGDTRLSVVRVGTHASVALPRTRVRLPGGRPLVVNLAGWVTRVVAVPRRTDTPSHLLHSTVRQCAHL